MASQAVTESEVLPGLPPYSRIVTPRAFTYIKFTDGIWYNWANGTWGHPFNPPGSSEPFPVGSRAFIAPNDQYPTYVKGEVAWLKIPHHFGQTVVNQHGQGPFANAAQILYQTPYRSGPDPTNDLVVTFNASMVSAENLQVEHSSSCAFSGDLMVREKVTIRLGFLSIGATDYQARQHNLQRAHSPITRGDLAFLVAREVKIAMDALRRMNRPLMGPGGHPVAFENLTLINVRRVSRGSLQPTIAVYGA